MRVIRPIAIAITIAAQPRANHNSDHYYYYYRR
jgi:hypothetical protein